MVVNGVVCVCMHPRAALALSAWIGRGRLTSGGHYSGTMPGVTVRVVVVGDGAIGLVGRGGICRRLR